MSGELPGGGAVLAWRQLLRLGNVFTAASNVIAGFLIVRGDSSPAGVLAALVAASACLYAAGMALNDAYDAELDARERPERPIPSGRISRSAAFSAGWALLATGAAFSGVAVALSGLAAPAHVTCCLAVMIVMYDGGLKRTWAGPWAMGWCRTLNVLLGGCLAADTNRWLAAGVYALCVGLYTVGVTMLASREAGEPPRGKNRWGKEVLAVACGLLFAWPWTLVGDVPGQYGPVAATVGLFAFAIYAAIHASRASRALDPRSIRAAVKQLLVGFILIDACAATAVAGWISGLAVLALLAPTLIASRQAPMT